MKPVLNESQIERIADTVKKSNIASAELKIDLIDHLCCIAEDEISKGKDFKVAYDIAFQRLCPNGLGEIQDETLFLFTAKRRKRLDRTIYVSGLLFLTGTLITLIMKILHLPFAQLVLLITACVGLVIFFPAYMFRQTPDKKPMNYTIGIAIVILLLAVSSVFFISHWPGVYIIMLLAVGCAYWMTFPLFFLKIFKKSK